jgi:hypothetical protein
LSVLGDHLAEQGHVFILAEASRGQQPKPIGFDTERGVPCGRLRIVARPPRVSTRHPDPGRLDQVVVRADAATGRTRTVGYQRP